MWRQTENSNVDYTRVLWIKEQKEVGVEFELVDRW